MYCRHSEGSPLSDLFNLRTINRLCHEIVPTERQKESAREWLTLLEGNQLEDEKKNYFKFAQIILQDILGYPIKELDFENNNVEFQFSNSNGKNILCFEAKGTKTKDLFSIQHRTKKEHSTPIKQIWDYIGSIGLDYGICTNYKEFVLITKQFGYSKYHLFDFKSIQSNEEKLREFIGIFSKTRIIEKGFVEKLEKESIIEEKELTDEFYKLFHTTRLMLIEEFHKEDVTKNMSIQMTQTFLNRLIFWFFAEDRDFVPQRLFYDKVTKLLESNPTEYSKSVFTGINDMFTLFDKGSHEINIFGFNGGLFSGTIPHNVYFNDLQDKKVFNSIPQNHKLSKFIQMDENTQKIIQKHRNLNPIISNLLLMESFDSTTDINVNILGHIFEQSITDLEGMQGSVESKRKKEGVYYTPEYITDYICKNTIIPYLSKSGKITDPYDLVDEYQKDIKVLEKKFKEITICDPACGSGAFLVKAVDILLEIHKAIQEYKDTQGQYSGLDKWNEESEIRAIIENNIYGVDINREAVEISRLAMFFKTASNKRKLPDLSKNILVGNSLIFDKENPNAFSWGGKFPNIFFHANLKQLNPEHENGFSVIIGNPPYVRYQELEYVGMMNLEESTTFKLEKNFTIPKYTDLSTYFFYHSINIMKNGAKLGFIASDSWLHSGYGKTLQKVILDNCSIEKIIRTTFNVFEDADIKTIITILEKKESPNTVAQLIYVDTKDEIICNNFKNILTKPQTGFELGNWNLYFLKKDSKDIGVSKIDMIKMEPNICKIKIGKLTGCDSFFVLSKEIIKEYQIPQEYLKPILSKNTDGVYLTFDDVQEYFLSVDEPKGKLIKSDNGKNILKYINHGEQTTIVPKVGKDRRPKLIPKLYNLKEKKIWYSLNLGNPPPILIARFGHKRVKLFENNANFHSTRRNIGITPNKKEYTYALLAYLRSSHFSRYLEKNGHSHGGGVLEIRVTDYRNALVPNFDKMTNSDIAKMENAWKSYKNDLDQDKLDGVVSDVLGFTMDERTKISVELEILIKQRIESKKSK